MRVLVACEFSGVVRNAFLARGHFAWSCDLEASELGGPHFQGPVSDVLGLGWDLMVAFPPCTYLARSGARWWSDNWLNQALAIQFVRDLLAAPIPRIAIENPIGALTAAIRAPDQVVHPWQFGHGVSKATCLWLKNLPNLSPTCIVEGREEVILNAPDSAGRSKNRSRTFTGIADAMADQWGVPGVLQGEFGF